LKQDSNSGFRNLNLIEDAINQAATTSLMELITA